MLMGLGGSRASLVGWLDMKGWCGWGYGVVAYVSTLLTISRFDRRDDEAILGVDVICDDEFVERHLCNRGGGMLEDCTWLRVKPENSYALESIMLVYTISISFIGSAYSDRLIDISSAGKHGDRVE